MADLSLPNAALAGDPHPLRDCLRIIREAFLDSIPSGLGAVPIFLAHLDASAQPQGFGVAPVAREDRGGGSQRRGEIAVGKPAAHQEKFGVAVDKVIFGGRRLLQQRQRLRDAPTLIFENAPELGGYREIFGEASVGLEHIFQGVGVEAERGVPQIDDARRDFHARHSTARAPTARF
ncbi:MAG: hypothetical protein ABI056_05805 [Caulobacteraceae bacterium]